MGDAEQTVVRVLPEIAEIEAELWDACANPQISDDILEESYNPFISHAFLDSLEQSGSVSAEAGWAPQHLVMEDGAG
ncbi:MAG: peptidogalycan biosysnthesis protein, partial [Methyloligellaceae bacterium]